MLEFKGGISAEEAGLERADLTDLSGHSRSRAEGRYREVLMRPTPQGQTHSHSHKHICIMSVVLTINL